MVFFPNPTVSGLDQVNSLGDGQTINIKWFKAYPENHLNSIAYFIYYSTKQEDVYAEGVKYVSIDSSLEANIINLTPGQMYFFSVRPIEYNPLIYNLANALPLAYDNLRLCPYSLLRTNITKTDLIIPLLDTSEFGNSGIIKIGAELIRYTSNDQINNNLVVPGSSFIDGYLVDQGSGQYYKANIGNTGDGYISGLVLINTTSIQDETWKVICVGTQGLTGTAKFETIGSKSGVIRDGYFNPILWMANGEEIITNIFKFAIFENPLQIFAIGDSFMIETIQSSEIDSGRGYGYTIPADHNTSGYDGYMTWNPYVSYYISGEDNRWDHIFKCQSRYEYPNYPMTNTDGYHQVTKDLLTTDLSASDDYNIDFPMYDYAGYHRTDPVQLLNGTCVGSYIGGEMGCIDKFGNTHMLRGFSLQDHNNQRQEIALSVTGRQAILIKRVRTGITCSCYLASSEYPDDRCPMCYGTKFVFGYEQYFNPRRSDGRILVRPSPADEDLKMTEAGLESEFILDFWTLTVPTIKDRDIIILFDQNNVNEEYRYEVLSVTRNNTIVGLQGGQKFRAQRIRKFDPAYQIRVFSDSSMFPSKLNTSIGSCPGILPHTHEIVISEKITAVSQINQTTAVSQGHNHPIINGVVQTVLGHTHTIIIS